MSPRSSSTPNPPESVPRKHLVAEQTATDHVDASTQDDSLIDGKDSALAARATGTSWRSSVLRYYTLTKPRVLYGNVITAAAGFLFASPAQIDWWLFLAVCVGTTLVIGAACVLNNVLDRDIDTLMARTKKRATVTGGVGARNAVIYSIILWLLGMGTLVAWTNALVVWVGLGGFLAYVVLYGMYSKRMSIHGILVGSLSGAAPILGGYVGAANTIDAGAVITFMMMFIWQLPAFYSIAVYRQAEYARANVPVISVVRGIPNTIVQILVYTVVFVAASLLLQPLGYVGWTYTSIMGVLGLGWIAMAVQGLRAADADRWARLMFRYALIMMVAISVLLSVGPRLP